MEVNEFLNMIMNNGFPVAVSAYLLIRLEKQLDNLSGSINRLNSIISAKIGVPISPEKNCCNSIVNSDCEKTA